MKSIYFIMTSLLLCFTLSAQSITEKTKKEINRIKLSRAYISAEATMPTQQEAIDVANESLIQSIEQWVKEEKGYKEAKQFAIQDIKSCVEKLDMNRGSNVRVLVYIKKKDIIPIYNGKIILSDEEKIDLPQNKPSNTVVEVTPKETTTAARQAPEQTSQKVTAQPSVSKPKKETKRSSLQRIIEAQTMNEIKVIFQELKADFGITYGKMTSADLDVSACCLLFYNREGKVVGVLGEGDQTRTNLRTNQPDKLSNYSGNAAYWFVITKE